MSWSKKFKRRVKKRIFMLLMIVLAVSTVLLADFKANGEDSTIAKAKVNILGIEAEPKASTFGVSQNSELSSIQAGKTIYIDSNSDNDSTENGSVYAIRTENV